MQHDRWLLAAAGLIVQPVKEETMNVSRRDFAVASAVALGASGLLLANSAEAQAADEAAVAQAVETLRKAILEADKAKLEQVAATQISYGHSDGRVQNKAEFIDGVMTRKQIQKSLTFPELKVFVAGNSAVARHIYLGESELDGKQTNTRIGALQVWQKQDGGWKLLARQGFRLPA
jgi:ketosteroid isomerase-like protein